MPTQCSDIDTLTQTYLDGELAERDLHDFESHIASCSECAILLRAEADFHSNLRDCLTGPPANDLLKQRIELALDTEDDSAQRSKRRNWLSWSLPGASVLAAAAALALFALDTMHVAPAAKQPIELDAYAWHFESSASPRETITPFIVGTHSDTLARPRFRNVNTSLRSCHRRRSADGRKTVRCEYEAGAGYSRRLIVDIFGQARYDLSTGEIVLLRGSQHENIAIFHGENAEYVFRSSDMALPQLKELVLNSGLVVGRER